MKKLLVKLLGFLVSPRPRPTYFEDVKWDALDGAEFTVILPKPVPPATVD